jgi:hypothetical protein
VQRRVEEILRPHLPPAAGPSSSSQAAATAASPLQHPSRAAAAAAATFSSPQRLPSSRPTGTPTAAAAATRIATDTPPPPLFSSVSAPSPFFFNTCLLNYYRDGKDSVGWHSDDEPIYGPRPLIASVSLGAARDFVLRRKNVKGDTIKNGGKGSGGGNGRSEEGGVKEGGKVEDEAATAAAAGGPDKRTFRLGPGDVLIMRVRQKGTFSLFLLLSPFSAFFLYVPSCCLKFHK